MWAAEGKLPGRNPSRPPRCSKGGGTTVAGARLRHTGPPGGVDEGRWCARFAQRRGAGESPAARDITAAASFKNRASMALRQPVAPSNCSPTWPSYGRKAMAPGAAFAGIPSPGRQTFHQFRAGQPPACA